MSDRPLTAAEARALRVVRDGSGKTSWYQVARVLSPVEFPDQDINAVRVLAVLEARQLIEKVEGGGKLQWFRSTDTGDAVSGHHGIERARA